MAYRVGLADLVSRLRVLANDPSGAVFTDGQCANALDAHRWEMRWVPLLPQPTYTPSGIQWLDYYSDVGNWASDLTLYNTGYQDVTATVTLFEPIVGHFGFASTPAGIALRATGTTHDLYAAAADLLEWQASAYTLSFDFGGGDQSFRRSQQASALLALAQRYRQQALPRSGRMQSLDLVPEGLGSGNAVVYPTYASVGGY